MLSHATAQQTDGWFSVSPLDKYRLPPATDKKTDVPDKAKFLAIKALAEKGKDEAQHDLGVSYIEGRGVERNYAEAVKWFRKAADHGYAPAQSNLGAMYEHGLGGLLKDSSEAMNWYRKAADQENAKAQYNLGRMYQREKVPAEALKWYLKAADQGYAEAQHNLGVMYGTGEGVEKSDVEGVKWYRKAAEQGYAPAQSNLGTSYYEGRGVPKDFAEAKKWLLKAALQDHPEAQANLGVMYAKAEGENGNYVEAYAWLNIAAKSHAGAATYRSLIEKNVPPDQVGEGQKRSIELRALIDSKSKSKGGE